MAATESLNWGKTALFTFISPSRHVCDCILQPAATDATDFNIDGEDTFSTAVGTETFAPQDMVLGNSESTPEARSVPDGHNQDIA